MRDDRPATGDEQASLLAVLDYARATVRAKCEGLTDDDAHRALLPTSPLTTIGGLVNHLRWVDCWWIEDRFLGREGIEYPWTDDDPDGEFRVGAQLPLADILDAYDAQSARYVDILAGDLSALAVHPFRDGAVPNLRWVILHLIEETARHNGHLDILRELIDGTVGSFNKGESGCEHVGD